MTTYMARHGKIAGRIVKNLLFGLILFIVAGNLTILGANLVARATAETPPAPELAGIPNLAVVDENLWRGGAPTEEGLRQLASHGVGTIVDLRAEEDIERNFGLYRRLGLDLVRIPMRDGQAPRPRQVERFLDVMRRADKRVFVHCGAGVGRTGTMAGAYLVKTGRAESSEALTRNLSVGPPSLEQLSFVAELSDDDVAQPSAAVTLMSRVIDGPRRIWVNVTNAYSP
ncbi:MAG: dual specificity protein phosphatase family protein [Actinomycetota bacterium]|nr:dual specificity protein phosphatase family protein [Actinomycetota bacterium]